MPDDALRYFPPLDRHRLRATLPELSVVYRGEDIQKSNLNLKVVRLRISNAGTSDVLQTHYDQGDQFGFRFVNARVLEVRQLDSSSPYLASAVKPALVGPSTVLFAKPIFEVGAWFGLELLLIHDKSADPTLIPLGKIAGVEHALVVRPPSVQPVAKLWDDLAKASLAQHLTRLVVYTLASLLILIAGVATIAAIGSWFSTRRQRRRSERLRALLSARTPEEIVAKDILLDVFGEQAHEGLNTARRFATDSAHLKTAIGEWRSLRRLRRQYRATPRSRVMSAGVEVGGGYAGLDDVYLAERHGQLARFPSLPARLAGRLLAAKLVGEENGQPQVHPSFREMVDKAIAAVGGEMPGPGQHGAA